MKRSREEKRNERERLLRFGPRLTGIISDTMLSVAGLRVGDDRQRSGDGNAAAYRYRWNALYQGAP